jgi:hypothetical protein
MYLTMGHVGRGEWQQQHVCSPHQASFQKTLISAHHASGRNCAVCGQSRAVPTVPHRGLWPCCHPSSSLMPETGCHWHYPASNAAQPCQRQISPNPPALTNWHKKNTNQLVPTQSHTHVSKTPQLTRPPTTLHPWRAAAERTWPGLQTSLVAPQAGSNSSHAPCFPLYPAAPKDSWHTPMGARTVRKLLSAQKALEVC